MGQLKGCFIYCGRCEKEIEEVTRDYLETYYKDRIHSYFIDDEEGTYMFYVTEHWRKCPDCMRESLIVPHHINRKDLRHIATKDERNNKRKVTNYKKKKQEAKYQEW